MKFSAPQLVRGSPHNGEDFEDELFLRHSDIEYPEYPEAEIRADPT